jgi:Cu-processing system permease protein
MMSPILTIAHLTLYESRRRKILGAALLCGLAFLTVYGIGLWLGQHDLREEGPLQRQLTLTILTVLGLYAASFLSVLLAVLLPVDTLSGDIDSGVMQTLASKPITRTHIVLGKWLGHWVIVAGYLVLLCLSVVLITRLAGRTIRLDVWSALPLLILQITFMMSLSIAGGTRFGTVANGVLALAFFGVAFLGGWMEQLGALAGVDTVRTVGVAASLVSPADSMWRLGVYYLQPAIVRDTRMGPLALASVPNQLMVWWTLAATALVIVCGVRTFRRRAL